MTDFKTENYETRIESCSRLVTDPRRLEALRKTGLMDSPREEIFDRLTRSASRLLRVPITIISLVGHDKQFFKAFEGLPSPLDKLREVPIDSSICKYTLHGQPLIIEDAQTDFILKDHPATKPLGIVAFLAIPMITQEGHTLGAFCAIDVKKRSWTTEDIEILKDLTQSVMTEISLRATIEKLKEEKERREKFVAVLAHDLRAPLTAAKLITQTIERTTSNEKSQTPEKLKKVVSNLDRLDRMIQNLLDANRIRAGKKLPLVYENFDIKNLISETIAEFSSTHGNRFIFDSLGSVQGSWSKDGIQRILENLLNNALKYGDADSPISILLDQKAEYVTVSVHNYGTPINAEDRSSLFDAFSRANTAEKNIHQGWGLGLTLVRGDRFFFIDPPISAS